MTAIPPGYWLHAAIILCVIGVTATVFGMATVIDAKRGRANCGDACTAFGLICCAMATALVGWSDVGLPVLAGVALLRMVIAIVGAVKRRRDSTMDRTAADAPWPTSIERQGDSESVMVRLETPIDLADLAERPGRPAAVMDAIVRQLGADSRIVAIQARKG